MSTPRNNPGKGAGKSWPNPVRVLALTIGVAVSAAAGFMAALSVMILAIILDAAPLLAGETTPRQAWVTPVAVAAGMLAFGGGVWFIAKTVRRHPAAS